jgi:hypothetical protein
VRQGSLGQRELGQILGVLEVLDHRPGLGKSGLGSDSMTCLKGIDARP